MILSFLFFAFLAYLLFKLVFDFVIPIYKTTKKVKKTFREMQQKMQEQAPGQQRPKAPNGSPPTSKKQRSGDYIDFEEVKE